MSTKAILPPTVLYCACDRVSQTQFLRLSHYFGAQLPMEELPTHWLYSRAHCGAVKEEMALEVLHVEKNYKLCLSVYMHLEIVFSKVLKDVL